MLNKKQIYSEEIIHKYALSYLNKFSTSKTYLTNFLIKKIKSKFIVPDCNVLHKEVEKVVIELTSIGFLNDVAFCESRIKSLLREGNSIFNITIRLKKKLISQECIDKAFSNILISIDSISSLLDLEKYALLKYIKKRNILFWQQPQENFIANKAINSLLRKGFPFNLIEDLFNNKSIYTNQDIFENYIYNLESKFNF